MSEDLFAIIGCCILGLIAHGCRKVPWLEWVIRVIIALFFVGELLTALVSFGSQDISWSNQITLWLAVATGIALLKPFRQLLSILLTIPNQIISGRPLLAAAGKLHLNLPIKLAPVVHPVEAVQTTVANQAAETAQTPESAQTPETAQTPESAQTPETAQTQETTPVPETTQTQESAQAKIHIQQENSLSPQAASPETLVQQTATRNMTFAESFLAERVFVPESIPHLNGLWIYITCLAALLAHTELSGFKFPAIMIPIPATFDQLFSYNFFGLIFLAFCGAGIFVYRSPLATLKRLGLEKPSLRQVFIGFIMIAVTFTYDYLWSTYTHSQDGLGYAQKLSNFNEGTFVAGGAGSALALATATGFCAGLGEEILCRGALQPVFGILPAAFLHGVLHGQFAHAPMLILQVFGWSTLMGIVRRYTNTTTTIIAHAGFNFVSTFLFAFNP